MLYTWATGATGLVGSRLAAKLASQGHGVRVLTRDVGRARSKLPYGRLEFFGPSDWQRGLSGATGVVNLAGVPAVTVVLRCALRTCQYHQRARSKS